MSGVITTVLCVGAFVIAVLVVFLMNAIRVVNEYQRLVVFRLGRCIGTKGPGFVFLIPIIDRAVKVDLREQERTIPPQVVITKENVSVTIACHWCYKVIDPALSVTRVGNLELAAMGMGITTLRALAGQLALVEILDQKEQLGRTLLEKLDEITESWGVKVTNFELREIILPAEIQEAVNRQVSDGRIRRVLDASVVNETGETETIVHMNGKVKLAGREWDAVSNFPILPSKKVRVQRIILEVVEDSST